ncbi:hypothetical protein [Sandaracinobacteroides hominis]|uniref:hypothetical protein n=1 Tax=Sandaracinobacteroides hominis TaxID=2780086 RepID=UPI0018F5D675|nr:hypothetical protein [Sandaracinobacteroides hominis]
MTASPSRARMFRPALLILPALVATGSLLTACKKTEDVAVAETDGKGTVVVSNGAVISNGTVVSTAGEGESLELTAQLPAFAPAYPGATVKTQIGDTASPDGKAKGSLVIFSTADPIAKVAAFYDAKAKELGLKAGMVVNDNDSAVRIFGTGNSGDKTEGALIAISKSDDGKSTEIVITSGAAEKEVKQWERQDWKSAPRPMPRLQ